MRLVLVRHGLAEEQQGRAVGHCDPPLSDQGRAEVERNQEAITAMRNRLAETAGAQ